MITPDEKLNLLRDRIKTLQSQQIDFQDEIVCISKEIDALQIEIRGKKDVIPTATVEIPLAKRAKEISTEQVPTPKPAQVAQTIMADKTSDMLTKRVPKKPLKSSEWEKFIGENLTNKIGILILILGIAIGTKYSIDNNLISPVFRILLGYGLSAVLGFFAFKTFKKYFNLSAALASGAVAGFYLVSYAAFDYFHFFSRGVALSLLVISVSVSVYLGMLYKKEVIALFGLFGAYGAPFLVSSGSNNVELLFIYIAVINATILYLSFKQNWRIVIYFSFIFSWLIFLGWYVFSGSSAVVNKTGMIFSTIFYLLFHLFFLLSRSSHDAKSFKAIGLLIANTIIYYLVFFELLENRRFDSDFTGWFSFIFAAVNGISAYVLYRKNTEDNNGIYVFTAFAILLTLVGIQIQCSENWVVVLYMLFAAGIFALGVYLKSKLFDIYAMFTLVIALLFFLGNSTEAYSEALRVLARGKGVASLDSVLNYSFLAAIVVCLTLLGMNILSNKREDLSYSGALEGFMQMSKFALPSFLLLCIFYSVNAEIGYYWDVKNIQSGFTANGRDWVFTDFKIIWRLNWGLLFGATLLFLSNKLWKSEKRNLYVLVISGVAVISFLFAGLLTLSEIREVYLLKDSSYLTNLSQVNAIRYISIGLLVLLGAVLFFNKKKEIYSANIVYILEIAMHATFFWVIASEVLHWMDLSGRASAYKSGLSITAGLYAILLIVLGIWKKRPYLRMMAFGLFGITLVKLFFYDITNMSRLTKTVVFILLGGMLLLISFLYNKYKQKMEIDQKKELEN